jgi:hypothetical protein
MHLLQKYMKKLYMRRNTTRETLAKNTPYKKYATTAPDGAAKARRANGASHEENLQGEANPLSDAR